MTTSLADAVPDLATAPDPPEPPTARPPRRSVADRLRGARALPIYLGFLVLALFQSPGRIVADTKLDLVVDPWGFLHRMLSLWDAEGFAGQLQNQAYGYLFPMGPFFALGESLAIPPWIVQRLWWALLMSAACYGVVLLARRLNIGTPTTALVAGIAYALAPRLVSGIGSTSSEILPMALAPWVLVPLAGAVRHGSARRAAALSALAVLCTGGVNAVATAAVFPLAGLFLLTRPFGPFRRRLAAWWVLCVGLATAWWAVPLLFLRTYSPPFPDYVENAAATTAPTDVLSVLRGTTQWVSRMASLEGPLWPAGYSLVHDALPVIGTIVVAAAGLVGLARRDLPERRWLVLGLVTGVGLVSLGHLAEVQGQWAGPLHELLDEALAPLRNLHKFDPVVRLPLTLGAAHLGAVLLRRARRRRSAAGRPRLAAAVRWGSRGLLLAVVLGLVATASPALAGRLAAPSGFAEIPGYWRQTADFLADQESAGRALLVPASTFGTYEWGNAGDEPLQPLASSPWEVRNIIPLTPEGHIRMLDAVEDRLSRGVGSPGLSEYLARSGFGYLVLRNDLDSGELSATRSALVREALAESGIERVATFGPDYPRVDLPDGVPDATVYDSGLDPPAPAIEVYRVADPAPRAWVAPLSDAVTAAGGPEAVLALADRDLVTGRPVLLAGSTSLETPTTTVSDTLLRRVRNFGRIAGAVSAGLTAADQVRGDSAARDYVLSPEVEAAGESLVRYDGGTPSASSSAADSGGLYPSVPQAQPAAAVDNDLTTSWRPSLSPDRPADWWRLTTDQQFLGSTVFVTLGEELGYDRPTALTLTTDSGSLTVPVQDIGAEQELPLPPGYSRNVTVSVPVSAGSDSPPLVLAEVRVPGVTVQRSVTVPHPDATPAVFTFDVVGGRSGCVTDAAGVARCAGALVSGAEDSRVMDRVFQTDVPTIYDVAITGYPRAGDDLDDLIAKVRRSPAVTSGSDAVTDARASAQAVLDGDPRTTWLSGVGAQPTLTFTFPTPRTIDSLSVVTDPAVAATAPTSVTVSGSPDLPGAPAVLDADGTARFAPITTSTLVVTFDAAEERSTFDPYSGRTSPLPVGVGEVEFGAPNPVVDPATPVQLPCGSGPLVQLDGQEVESAVQTTLGALQTMQPITYAVCDDGGSPAVLTSTTHRMLATGTNVFTVTSVTLTRRDALPPGGPITRQPAVVGTWDAQHRTVQVGDRTEPTLLVVPENTNPGWTASLDGEQLETVAVDGWQQGYVLPAGPAGTVALDFAPGTTYRQALLAGAAGVFLLGLLAVLPGRPSKTRPARGRGVLAGLLLVGLGALAMVLLGGMVGLAAAAGAWLVSLLAGRHRSVLLGALAAGAVLVAGTMLVLAPDTTTTAQQVLAVIAVAAVLGAALPTGWLPGGGPLAGRRLGGRRVAPATLEKHI